MNNIVLNILENSKYELKQFEKSEIESIAGLVFLKTNKKGDEVPYIECQVRNKYIKLTDSTVIKHMLETVK